MAAPTPSRLGLLGRLLGALGADESGATAVTIAVCMTALLGFAGIAVDVGTWYADKRQAQGAADAAAYSAAISSAAGDSAATTAKVAKAVAKQYGMTDGSGGVTVAVNAPPSKGSNTGTTGAVEVIVTKTEPLFFSSFYISSATVSARGVAVAGSSGGKFCMLTLGTSSNALLDMSGNVQLNTPNCGAYINASGSGAVTLSGGSTLTAKNLSVVGGINLGGGGTVTVSGTKSVGVSPMADPYANVVTPAPAACLKTNYQAPNTTPVTLQPGTYCNGLSISGGARVTFAPGVYIIDRGQFEDSGGSTVTGTGVTIVLTSSTGAGYAYMSVTGDSTFTVTAPTTGVTAGLAVMQDRRAPTGGHSQVTGNSSTVVTGALYFPTQAIDFSGGVTSNCLQIVAWQVTLSGNSSMNNNCAGTGVVGIGAAATTLVE
jgi:Flp pilus assembly protein TadG